MINRIPEEIFLEYQASPLICHYDIISDISHSIAVEHIVRVKTGYSNIICINRPKLLNF